MKMGYCPRLRHKQKRRLTAAELGIAERLRHGVDENVDHGQYPLTRMNPRRRAVRRAGRSRVRVCAFTYSDKG
jgi:hypothetical protein